MSIWKDLLFLGGYIATPAGLEAAAPEVLAPRDARVSRVVRGAQRPGDAPPRGRVA